MTKKNLGDKKVTWTIRNVPIDLKNEIVRNAKKYNLNTASFIKHIYESWVDIESNRRSYELWRDSRSNRR
jgi:hypothetical protein